MAKLQPEPVTQWVTVGPTTKAHVTAHNWGDAITETVQIGPVALTGRPEHLRRLVNDLRSAIPDALRRLECRDAA
jgi:hypothetical protein